MLICKPDQAADFQYYIKDCSFFPLPFSVALQFALPLQGRLTLLFAFVSI